MNKKILLIEDDDTISWIYKTKLESEGYLVVLGKNGTEALEMAKAELPDIIFLDIIIPQLDGFSVLKELKALDVTKDIPVIMLTNLGTEEDKIKGMEMGATDYFVKTNLTPSQFVEKINKYIIK